MMPNFSMEHAMFAIKDPVLQHALTFLDCLNIPETTYVTGRPAVPRTSMLKCFIIKTDFGIASLQKLVRFLSSYPYWCWIVGLPYVPHLSTFSRAATWWRTEVFFLHTAVLKGLPVNTKLESFTLEEQTSLIVTSNKGPKDWGELLYDPAIATAILDRLVHKGEVIHLHGESYRIKHRPTIFGNN
ncbi:ATP-binding protein [Aneurinibacillus thermoaerophilus]|uniref:ATP-binding protein n=3 Tax=Aneurinibacillus thermoaerophilus TaxID=143495 RepID=UPI003BEF3753